MGYFVLTLAIALPALGICQGRQVQYRELSPNVIQQRLETVAKKNADREQTLKGLLEAVGCQAERLTEQSVTRRTPPNVICTLPGATESVILIGAHFDHVPTSYGVIDDWSGASLLPSLYESIATVPRKHTFVFVGFTEEEKGLIGSGFYVKHLTAEETAHIRAMINLDSLALGPTKVWASRADPVLLNALAVVAQSAQLPLQGVNVDQVGRDDSIPFAAKKVPTISLHSVTQQTLEILHTPKDAMAAVKLSDFYQSYRLLAAYLAYLDKALK
jgi:Zn-dependent M28 family amino/carboxypeptidase